ncbi:MAG: hypothetical protein IJL80_14125 [Treponema sp.]|nr:hypothetical protein [Treponema sp.]
MAGKIVFITSHNWDTRRQGGFHKLAEAACRAGLETVFFSFPRPYYGLLLKREQLNAEVIKKLSAGVRYELEEGREILNVTFPTFRIPDACGKVVPACIMNFLLRHSLGSFRSFAKKFLYGTDCFVFESCEGIAFVDKIRKLFPNAKIIYRPSDPLVYATVPERTKALEHNMLLKADKALLVNEEGLAAYRRTVPEFDQKVNYTMLPNGVDLAPYMRRYPEPEPIKGKKSIVYVGAWGVEWPLLYRAAEELPRLHFFVVCPNYPEKSVLNKVEKIPNLTYIPGIKSSEVPAWITNCTAVMVPYVTDFYKDRPLGITAKYYQAMAAHKPIVAYSDTEKLAGVGVSLTYSYEDFIAEVGKAAAEKYRSYEFDLTGRDWEVIGKKFLSEVGPFDTHEDAEPETQAAASPVAGQEAGESVAGQAADSPTNDAAASKETDE